MDARYGVGSYVGFGLVMLLTAGLMWFALRKSKVKRVDDEGITVWSGEQLKWSDADASVVNRFFSSRHSTSHSSESVVVAFGARRVSFSSGIKNYEEMRDLAIEHLKPHCNFHYSDRRPRS